MASALLHKVARDFGAQAPRAQSARAARGPATEPAPERAALPQSEAERDVQGRLTRGLDAYNKCVDDYLLASARARERADEAVASAQLLRIDLERAKRRLLTLAPVGSDAWRRIKRRAVRTKKPRWLLAGTGPSPLSSEGVLLATGRLGPARGRKTAA